MRSACPYHLNISGFIHFTMSATCNISCMSLFVLTAQCYSYGTVHFYCHSSHAV
jgi:hypothetical protein